MSAKRIAMRKIREVLRLRLEASLYLTWPFPLELDDVRLAALFYP